MASTSPSELPKIKLYWLDQSRSQRILWLLEELKLPYELEIFHRDPKTKFAPPELKKIHALGKSPVLTITPPGSTEYITIAESAFIIEYLLDHFANESTLLPKRYREGQEGKVGGETEEWLRFKYFLHYAEGSLMPYLLISMLVLNIKKAPVPFFIKPITSRIAGGIDTAFLTPNLKSNFSFLESQLATSPQNGQYLCGPHLTGADVILSYPLINARGATSLMKQTYPKLWAYVDRLEAEPGYKIAVEKIIKIDGKYENFKV